MPMTEFEITYALAKQVNASYAIETNYGSIALDEELAQVVAKAVGNVLERRLEKLQGVQISQAAEQLGGTV